jgi:hypothetical protein
MIKKALLALTILATCATANASPIVHTSDFINNGDRTNFNGLENIPNDGVLFTGSNGPYLEDGISVQQVNGDTGEGSTPIAVGTTIPGLEFQGNFNWYPNGGDFGYTEITRSGGTDFENVGMLVSSPYTGLFGSSGGIVDVLYELSNNGSSVLIGSLVNYYGYLGFSGGGFDTIRLSNCFPCTLSTTVTDGHLNLLAFDSIELSGANANVPESSTLLLLGSGLLGLAAWRWKRVL